MNSSGQAVFVSLMLAVVVVILALAFTTPMRQFVDDARGNSTDIQIGMNCTSTTDKFVQAGCIVSDISPAYIFIVLLGIAGVIAFAKWVG